MLDPNESWNRARTGAIAHARRILATLEATPETVHDWSRVGTMQRWDAELHHLSDEIHHEGEFAK